MDIEHEITNVIAHMGTHAYKAGLTEDTISQYTDALKNLRNINAWKIIKKSFIEDTQPYKGMPPISSLKEKYYSIQGDEDRPRIDCEYCGGEGYLTAIKKQYDYTVCCLCAMGEYKHRVNSSIPYFNDAIHHLKHDFNVKLSEKEEKIKQWCKSASYKRTEGELALRLI